ALREPDGVADEVHDDLQEALLVTREPEVLTEFLTLEAHARLIGGRLELVDRSGHDLVEVDPHPLNRQDAGPEARYLENLVDQPPESTRSRGDDLDEPPLLVGEGTGDPLAQEIRGFANGRERRPQLVRHRGEELLLRLLQAPELARHRVERSGELTDLVFAVDDDLLLERSGGDGRRGGRQRLERLGQPVRDEP